MNYVIHLNFIFNSILFIYDFIIITNPFAQPIMIDYNLRTESFFIILKNLIFLAN